jgi:hypothetical protein
MVMAQALLALLLVAWAHGHCLAVGQASPGFAPETMPVQPVGDQEQQALKNYGKNLLKEKAGIDLDKLGQFQLFNLAPMLGLQGHAEQARPGSSVKAAGAGEALADSRFDMGMALEAAADRIDHFSYQDPFHRLPLALRVQSEYAWGNGPLFMTKIYLPVDRSGDFNFDSSMPLPSPSQALGRLLSRGGFDSPWVAQTSLSSQQGNTILGAGVSTRVRGVWDLRYMFERGMGHSAENHKVGVGREF